MNIVTKAGCRVFQTVLRLAIPILPYRSPKVLTQVSHIPGVPKEKGIRRLIARIRKMNHDMGIPETLSGIREEDILKLAAFAHKEANPLYPVPMLMGKEELRQLYYDVMEAKA